MKAPIDYARELICEIEGDGSRFLNGDIDEDQEGPFLTGVEFTAAGIDVVETFIRDLLREIAAEATHG